MPTVIDEMDAFLRVHTSRQGLPAQLYAAGEAVWQRSCLSPPNDPRWGRMLVALGELAAERLGDDEAAGLWFHRCLDGEAAHRDAEACTAAGYGQGVLWERQGQLERARQAYAAAASEGFRCAIIAPATLGAAAAAVRLGYQQVESLSLANAMILKQAWLGWTWLASHDPEAIDAALTAGLGRQLCAFLLPEDDPALLAGVWREWQPHDLETPTGTWRDGDSACMRSLFTVAAMAADAFLAEEDPSLGDAYRQLSLAR